MLIEIFTILFSTLAPLVWRQEDPRQCFIYTFLGRDEELPQTAAEASAKRRAMRLSFTNKVWKALQCTLGETFRAIPSPACKLTARGQLPPTTWKPKTGV